MVDSERHPENAKWPGATRVLSKDEQKGPWVQGCTAESATAT